MANTYKKFQLWDHPGDANYDLHGHWSGSINVNPDDRYANRYLMQDLSLGPVGEGTGYPTPGHAWFPNKEACMKAIDQFWNMEKPNETKKANT